ncbi:exodeoxyribonuclease VII small subunit [Actinacidiphila sp. SB3-2]
MTSEAKTESAASARGGKGTAGKGAAAEGVTSSLSYEQARGELVQVVQRLEQGGSTLEESLELWERGEELSRVCREWLEGARARLDAVLESEEDDEEEAPEEDDFEDPDPDADEVDDSEDDEDYVDDDEEDAGAEDAGTSANSGATRRGRT